MTAEPIRMSVKFARNSARTAVWCQMMAHKFPDAGPLYDDWAAQSWREAWDHLEWAKKTKKELAS